MDLNAQLGAFDRVALDRVEGTRGVLAYALAYVIGGIVALAILVTLFGIKLG